MFRRRFVVLGIWDGLGNQYLEIFVRFLRSYARTGITDRFLAEVCYKTHLARGKSICTSAARHKDVLRLRVAGGQVFEPLSIRVQVFET